jgi:tRNA(adenine34) deaminase
MHEAFMRKALEQAHEARRVGEVPVGAAVVLDGEVAGLGYNQPIGTHDPTAHAEIVAIRDAARKVGNYRLTGATLYVTVEPCMMCVGAMVHARIGTLVFGATEPKAGAVVSTQRAHEHLSLNHHIDVVDGVLEEECRQVMQAFFRKRRQAASGEREAVKIGKVAKIAKSPNHQITKSKR